MNGYLSINTPTGRLQLVRADGTLSVTVTSGDLGLSVTLQPREAAEVASFVAPLAADGMAYGFPVYGTEPGTP